MFTIDERYRGIPASREQVLAVHQSINAPHLAIPGKQAGPAQAFIVGLRGASGFGVFVYLFLSEVSDCAVYVSGKRNVTAEEYAAEESDAVAFVESMGFMMDNANWSSLAAQQQDELLKSLPVFLKDPKLAAPPGAARGKVEEKRSSSAQLGRLLASF